MTSAPTASPKQQLKPWQTFLIWWIGGILSLAIMGLSYVWLTSG